MSLRRHPWAQVGDTFGDVTVTRLVVADHTSNERVEVACLCGDHRLAYVFNLRIRPPKCNHAKARRDAGTFAHVPTRRRSVRPQAPKRTPSPVTFVRLPDGSIERRRA